MTRKQSEYPVKSARKKVRLQSQPAYGQASASADVGTSALARLGLPVLVVVLTVVAFLPTLQNGFVNWDDDAFLLHNPYYKSLGWRQLRWMFATCYLGSCMPLNYVTYALDYVFWGMNPVGYHLTSLLIHAANALLFYFLSLRLLRLTALSPARSWQVSVRLGAGLSALLFSLHPLRVEVVAWTLGREIAVAGFFFFLTLLCYLRASENRATGLPRYGWMGAAWVFYALSLLGKEAALTLPFALLVLDIYPLRRLPVAGKWFGPQSRRVWWEKLPFVLVALAAAVKAVLGKQQTGTLYPLAGYGLLPRFAQVLYSLAFYPWKTLIPIKLSPLYPLHPFTGLWNLPLLMSGFVVLSLTVGFFIARRRWPAGLAAWVFYLLLLMPVSGIVAFGPYIAADRFSYLPCLGWAVLGGAGLFYCWRLWASGRVGVRTLIFAQTFVVLLIVGLGALTWDQTHIWQNSESLWRHALALDEESSFAHNNLGLALAERGDLMEAVGHFRRALEIDPVSVEAHNSLAIYLAAQGRSEEAIHHLRWALQIDPADANTRNALGNVLADRGEVEEAIENFRKVLETNPESAETHYNLGRALAKRGSLEEAIAHYRKALEIDPFDADIHNNLGLVLASRGEFAEAVEQFHEALRVDPKYAKAYFNLGKILAQQGYVNEAVQDFREALRIQPGVAEIHENLARALTQLGRKQEAVQHYQEAVRILNSGSPAGQPR
jgi:tetratricopeptide (TPR) repeat protein